VQIARRLRVDCARLRADCAAFARRLRGPCFLFEPFAFSLFPKDSNGKAVDFSKFKGKVVYGVNVASKCGYTESGYALLSRIAALKDKGIEVALFPVRKRFTLLYLLRNACFVRA
jgi:hypothetical protein